MSEAKVDPFAPDDDAPVWTDEEIARASPGREVFAELGMEPPRPRGRPKSERPKQQVTLRLDADVLAHYRAKGPGWQTELNQALRSVAFKSAVRPAAGGANVKAATGKRVADRGVVVRKVGSRKRSPRAPRTKGPDARTP